jgi:hypothetical protein
MTATISQLTETERRVHANWTAQVADEKQSIGVARAAERLLHTFMPKYPRGTRRLKVDLNRFNDKYGHRAVLELFDKALGS